MTSISKYQVYCTTESKYYTCWKDTVPTVCPNNSAHSINSSTMILETISSNDVKILETSIMMGYETRKPEERIITPYKINDNFIHFKETENSLDKYSLDRRTGLLLLNYKSSKGNTTKEELKIYYSCVKKNKLF